MNLEDLLSKTNYYFIKTAYIKIPEELLKVVESYVIYNINKYFLKEDNSIDIENFNPNTTENTQAIDKPTGFTDKIKNILNKIIRNSPGTSSVQTFSPVKEPPAIDWKSNLKSIQVIGEEERSVTLRIPLEIMPYYNSMTEEHFNKYFADKFSDDKFSDNIIQFKNLKYVALTIRITDSGNCNFTPSNDNSWADKNTFFIGIISINPNKYVESVVNHELTHFMQSYISMMTGHDLRYDAYSGGTPKKKDIIKNISPIGRIINVEKKCKKCGRDIYLQDKNCRACGEQTSAGKAESAYLIKNPKKEDTYGGYEKSKRIDYSQQDVEYYPRFGDQIKVYYPKYLSYLPKELHQDPDTIYVYVGAKPPQILKDKIKNLIYKGVIASSYEELLNYSDSFFVGKYFKSYLDENPEKWKSAAKEFYRILNEGITEYSGEPLADSRDVSSETLQSLNTLLSNNSDKQKIIEYVSKLSTRLISLSKGLFSKNPEISFSDLVNITEPAKKLSTKYQKWLVNRFGANATKQEAKTIIECLPILEEYAQTETNIFSFYNKSNKFNETLSEKFPNLKINDIETMSAQDMSDILQIYISYKNFLKEMSNADLEKISNNVNLYLETIKDRDKLFIFSLNFKIITGNPSIEVFDKIVESYTVQESNLIEHILLSPLATEKTLNILLEKINKLPANALISPVILLMIENHKLANEEIKNKIKEIKAKGRISKTIANIRDKDTLLDYVNKTNNKILLKSILKHPLIRYDQEAVALINGKINTVDQKTASLLAKVNYFYKLAINLN